LEEDGSESKDAYRRLVGFILFHERFGVHGESSQAKANAKL